MIFFLIVGIILGGVSVLFILENAMPITVTFFAWQMSGSLSTVLFAAVLSGVAIALLVLLPSFIKDDMYVSVLKAQKKELENELAEKTRQLAETPAVITVV
ncbi:MAG: lipopolysaccharide assembly protein LapA domain-containing protein [Candidatus Adlerbacteria bacterium]|nr:lipopolysaccharide assembly protein LapA domain-containing protein [Candidatus Adlerbacteria bacterium]